MSTYSQTQLGNLVDKVIDYRGKTPKKLKGKWSDYGIPALSAKNIKGGKIVNDESIRFVDDELYSRWMKDELQKDDILMTSEAPLGETYFVKTKAKVCLSQRLFGIRANKEKIVPKFLFYYFNTVLGKYELQSRATGTTVGGIRQSALLNVIVHYPEDTKIQSLIVTVISAYDDLIEVNEKRIQVLEEMARRFYIEWFVKLKFPGHEKIRMVDSGFEYGKIPERWEVKTLGEVMNFVRGRSYSSEQISDTKGDYYIVNLKSFNRGGGFRFDGEKYYSGPVNDDQYLERGDVVVAITDMTNDRAVIARPARVPCIPSKKVTFSADVVKIVSEKVPASFIYYCLLDHRFTEATKQKANGANVLHLKPAAILEHKSVIPPTDLLNEFEKKVHVNFELIDALLRRNQCLAKIRDILIPQLIMGRRELK